MKRRRAAVLTSACRHLVAERDGASWATPMSATGAAAGLQVLVEDSIYIDKDAVGRRRKALLPVLIEQCTALGKPNGWQ